MGRGKRFLWVRAAERRDLGKRPMASRAALAWVYGRWARRFALYPPTILHHSAAIGCEVVPHGRGYQGA